VGTKQAIQALDAGTKQALHTLKIEVQNIVLAAEHRILFWMFTTMLGGLAIAVAVARSV
jgi:hypothetical protein